MSFTNCKPHNYRCNTIDDVAETCPYCEIDTLRERIKELTQGDSCWYDLSTADAFRLWAKDREQVRELESKLARYEQSLNQIAEHGGSDSCQCFRVARKALTEDV